MALAPPSAQGGGAGHSRGDSQSVAPGVLADIYAQCFPGGLGWSAADFEILAQDPSYHLAATPVAFALGRMCGPDEAELLMIATHPSAQRHGHGRHCLTRLESRLRTVGARRIFLEVAADNAPAKRLYLGAGYTRCGRRAGYYGRPGGAVDALILEKAL